MKRLLPSAVIAVALLGACGKGAPESYEPVAVAPLYKIMYDYHRLAPSVREEVYDRDSSLIASFMPVVSAEPCTPDLVEWWSNSMPVTVFTPDVDTVFTSLSGIEAQLGHILGVAASDTLGLPERRYAAVVYGRPESILFNDSTMMIALNHYLGEDYPGYSHWPGYMRRQKSPDRIPYDIAEALVATQYPYQAEGAAATVLSRMLYEGALTSAKMALVENSDLALALGYNDSDLRWLQDNEKAIWRDMVGKQMLYDTSEALAERLVLPSPQVRDVVPAAPGRVGRYIGYRIVEAYCNAHPGTTLRQLLSPGFYTSASSLIESHYSSNG